MAAPTPVSALVHSSTLVTAGVYLLVRFNHLLVSRGLLKYLLVIGTVTMFMAGLVALREIDMKKIIALSTLSQLGVIIMVTGAGLPVLGFYHLLAHAYFKAILFMCAGTLIHSLKDYQDVRAMGQGLLTMPFSLRILTAANLRLCGLPFMSGFYSKDIILERMGTRLANMLILALAVVGTAFTVMYSVRLTALVFPMIFGGEVRAIASETAPLLNARVLILLGPAVVGGLILSWALFPSCPTIVLPLALKGFLFLIVTVTGLVAGLRVDPGAYRAATGARSKGLVSRRGPRMWFLPLVIRSLFTRAGLGLGKGSTRAREHR